MKTLLMWIGIICACVALAVAAHGASDNKMPKCGFRELWTIDSGKMNRAEEIMASTLQGHAARSKQARIWIKTGGMSQILLDQMRSEGVAVHEAASAWDLLSHFRNEFKGAIVYRAGNESLSVATSLCGPMSGVAVDESILEQVKTEGVAVIEDVREMTEREALNKYGKLFKHGTVVCQGLDKGAQLRDFAVANNSFVFHHNDSAFCTEVAKAFGPTALVYGWGKDEFLWVRDVSSGNATCVPADWCLNLSVMQSLPAGRIKRPDDRLAKAEDGKRYVAFVMSDGDNIQVLCGGFVDDKGFWGSSHRGKFPMTWEMSPVLADAAPRVLQHFHKTATPNDAFVTGPGVPGYTFPHFQPDRAKIAKQAAAFMRKSDLRIASVLNDNAGSLTDTIPLLDQPNVDAVIYKDYAPYHKHKGEILWHNGKPCISYKFVLWAGIQEPEDIAREVAKMPASPLTDQNSYALINVHAWSYGSMGGPMEAVKKTIDLLPKDTAVVTAPQLISMLRENHGRTN